MAISTVQFSLNGQTYNLTYDSSSGAYKATISAPSASSYNVNSDHTYHGTVEATDTAGNTASAGVSDFAALALRVLEKVAPVIAVTYPTAAAYIVTSQPTIAWTVTDSGSGVDPSTVKITIDGTAYTSGITKTAITNGYSCEFTPSSALADGSHTVLFDADDNDGNSAAQVSVIFTVDTVPPTLNVDAPTAGLVTNVAACAVSGTTNDATSSPVTLTVNGSVVTVNADGTWSTSIQLSEGSNTITIVATDAAGRSTTITRTVTLDTTPPVITAVTITPNPVDAGATYVITVTVTD